jgi:hypothetical protein
MMGDKVSLADAITAAAAHHGTESSWTDDGEQSFSLTDWAALKLPRAAEPIFTFDRNRIVRQGADVQDFAVVLYLANERCDTCRSKSVV